MRRADREITDRAHIDRIIRGCEVCHLAFAMEDEPYVLPFSFGYDGEALYLHTAREGRKLHFIAHNPRVCFEFTGNVQTIPDADRPCGWSVNFESVVGYGTITELFTREDKVAGLNHIMRQYSGREWDFGTANLDAVRVWRIAIDTITGKHA